MFTFPSHNAAFKGGVAPLQGWCSCCYAHGFGRGHDVSAVFGLPFGAGQRCLWPGRGPVEAALGAGALMELWVTGDAVVVAAQVTPGVSHQHPEAQCLWGDHSYWGRVGAMCRKKKEGQAFQRVL